MCEPMTLAMAALQGASSMAGINAQNEAHVKNRANALQAQNIEIDDTGRQYVEQNRSLIQGGFDAILEGRSAEAEAFTSAIQNGVQGSSVRALMRDRKQKTNRNATRTAQSQDSLKTQVGANMRHISNKTQGRINSVSSTGFGIGDMAGVLAPIVRAEME